MKIAIDCRYIGKSGIGTYIDNVVDRLLAEHLEHKYVLVCEKGSAYKTGENVYVCETEIKPFSLKELYCFPVNEINGCDAFFSPYINIPGGIDVPVFSTIHDCVFFDVDGLISPAGRFVRKLFYMRAVRLSNKIFTVSEFSKERILYHFPTDKEIIVTSNGISNAIREHKPKADVSKQDYFIYVGNIKRHKGLHTLIEAFNQAKKSGLSSKLVIVGNNSHFRTADESLTSLIENTKDIEFTGWVSEEKLIELVFEAKALVQPSMYEGFGIPPLEALYLGTDAIISDIPVFTEIYCDLPVTFFRCDDANKLAEIMLNHRQVISDVKSTCDKIDRLYNISDIANTILKTMQSKI